MNKITKGAIAGAAGIALLLGGAGSFALWSDSTIIDAGTVTAGTLQFVDSPNDGTWTINNVSAGTDITSHRVVPGDVLTFTKLVTVKATGDNLRAELSLNPASIQYVSSPANDALVGALLSQPIGFSASTTSNVTYANGVVSVSGQDADTTATITVTLTFPEGAVGDNSAQDGQINLDGLEFTLTQA
jgi:alternate signal-mediated exported protein